MKQAYLDEPMSIVVRNVSTPVPGNADVLIRVDHVGICGSDMHAFYGKHPFIALPIVLGHEASGVIVSVGADVQSVQVGDRVVIEPSLACGECARCIGGQPHICDQLRVIGCQFPGAFGEFVVVPQDNVVRLPDDVPLQHGALVEPLAVGVRACRRGHVAPGVNVCVVGAGTIGIMTAFAARELGASRVLLMDIQQTKCDTATGLGFEAICNANVDPAELMQQYFGLQGPDVIIECVGVEPSVRFCMLGAPKGGRIVIVGVFEDDARVPMALVQDRELSIIGTLMYATDDFAQAVQWMAEGRIPAERLITRVFPLAEAASAFAYIREQHGAAIKVLLQP